MLSARVFPPSLWDSWRRLAASCPHTWDWFRNCVSLLQACSPCSAGDQHVVTWGDETHQNEMTRRVLDRSGIPDCIGMLDGSLIRLTEIPDQNGLTFICQKKFPAVSNSQTQHFLLTYLIRRSMFKLLSTTRNDSPQLS
jgi:hypothetical protein